MMFVNNKYSQYKYVVSTSDNYIILTNQSNVNASWDSPKTIQVIYQYLNPSFLTVESGRTFTNNTAFEEIETTNSFFARADCNQIILSQFLVIFFVIFVLNGLTRFVKKGGVFFGK